MAVPVSFDRTNITFDSTGYTWDATSEETGIEVTPGTGELLIEGFAPTVFASADQNILPSFGELTILGFSPEASVLNQVFPSTGILIIYGFSPTAFASNTQVVYPGTGEVLVTGHNPKITLFNKAIFPQSGTLIIAGYSPSVQLDNKTIFPSAGSIIFRGFRPIVTGQISNNCNSDSERLERIIRGSENTMSDLYALISASISKYFEVLANCCIGKNNNLKSAIILIDDYINFNDQAGGVINDVIDDIIDKILEDTPAVAIQYGAAYFNGVCIKELTPNLETVIEASFQSHICVLFEEPLPDFTYEVTYTDFVCSYDQGELFPYAYEATFMGHQCILRYGNYFYPEYSASFIDFICEFEPACDTFSAVLCTSSELCELSMTSEWLDYSCFIAERDFDISFADHSCIKNMTYEASYQEHLCVLQDWLFAASFIDFVCMLIEEVTTTTTTEVTTTTTVPVTTTTTSIVTTTTTTSEVTTTTTSALPPANCTIIFNTSANPTQIFTYDFDSNTVTLIATLNVASSDVAMSHNKLWIGVSDTALYEYDITFSPFTISPAPTRIITLPAGFDTTGIGSIDNNTLIIGGQPVRTIDISGSTAVQISSFNPSPTASLTGDVVYNPTSGIYTITYSGTYLGQYLADGTNINSVNTGIGTLYGLFVHNNIMYAARSNGQIYSINPTTLALTLVKTVPGLPNQINGAAQDPRCITQ